ncbi:hypothetical protein N8T08_006353 [Aspergillus melleus]|uniref:Uncharacterized protein n=1 Tax=Aspergillus melleus TaxID=138277 RepID=A0ACC3B049_9EURO|nr:hypothetical protein N8T08_006353 [Aspergillus melleus]
MSSIPSTPPPPNTNTNTNTNQQIPHPSPTPGETPNPHNNIPPSSSPSPQTEKETHEAKTAFLATLHSVGQNHETQIRDRARVLHTNAHALSKQENELQTATDGLRKQNDQWAKVADSAREGLKEIGDVQNWAELIERDLMVVEETVRLAEEKERVEEEEERERRGEGEGNGHLREQEGDGDGDGGGKDKGKGKGKGWFWW